MKYSTWLSPVGGDVFVSTQPWAAKGAWFVKLKNNIVAIHGSDFAGTEKAVKAFRARFITPAKGGGDLLGDEESKGEFMPAEEFFGGSK